MVVNMCQKSTLHKSKYWKKYNLNDRYIGDNPLNFCPKFKCPKLKCPKILVFNSSSIPDHGSVEMVSVSGTS